MRSLWLLNELGLDFEVVVHGFGQNLRSPEYLSIHPLGRVPCLEDGELQLFESGAICEYLCEHYDTRGLWRAPDHAERTEWLQWLHFAETVAVHGAALTQQHIVIYEDKDRSPLLMELEARRLEKALAVLDRALDGREYLLASGFSAVDTGVGYSVYVARYFVDLSCFPNLSTYFSRLQNRPTFHASVPQNGDAGIYLRPFYPLPEAL